MANETKEWQKPFNAFAEARDTDVYLFSGGIYDGQTDLMISTVRALKTKRANGALILCTLGGSADCAFQIARTFKRRYKKFVLYVFGKCKSAGTLLAIGADEIVMSEFGQFGPVDVQIADKEELFGQTPALDVQQSLATVSKFTFDTFSEYFVELAKAGLSTKIAAEVAKNLALGIISPISGQIDPLLLGRVDRSMKIASAYIDRLNVGFQGKQTLSGGYPSHSFVIDYEEAKPIFPSLREPDAEERAIEDVVRQWRRVPTPSADYVGMLSSEKQLPVTSVDEAESEINGKRESGKSSNGEQTKPSASTSVARPTAK